MSSKLVKYILQLVDGASGPLEKVGDAAEDAADDSDKLTDATKGTGLGFIKMAAAAAAAGTALVAYTQGLADSRNEITDWSTRTGIATGTLAGLRLAAQGSGLDFNELGRTLQGIPQRLAMIQQGSTESARGFDQLGVDVFDAVGKLRSSDDVLRDVLGSLSAIEDPTQRAAAASGVFGASATKLLQALGDPASLDHFVEQATTFGTYSGPAAAKAAADWQRSMASLKLVIGGVTAGLFDGLTGAGGTSPADILDDLAQGFVFFGEVAKAALSVITDNIKRTWDAFKGFAPIIEALAAVMDGRFMDAARTLQGFDVAGAWVDGFKAMAHNMATPLAMIDRVIDSVGPAIDKMGKLSSMRGDVAAAGSGAGFGGAPGGGGVEAAIGDAEELSARLADVLGFMGKIGTTMSTADWGMTSPEVSAAFSQSFAKGVASARAAAALKSAFSSAMEGAGAAVGGLGTAMGAISNPLGALGGMGPQGAAASAILSGLESIGREGTDAIVKRLEEQTENIVKGFASLPELFGRLTSDLPYAIGQAIADAIKGGNMFADQGGNIGDALLRFGEKTLNFFSLGTYGIGKGAAGGKRVGEGFAVGDQRFVNRTGMQFLHQNETVVRSSGVSSPSTQRRMGGQGSSGPPIIIQAAAVSTDVVKGLADVISEQYNPDGWGRGSRPVFGG